MDAMSPKRRTLYPAIEPYEIGLLDVLGQAHGAADGTGHGDL